MTTPTRKPAAKRRKAPAASPSKKVLAPGLLGADEPLFARRARRFALVPCTVLRRPSARNRSPYVADVELADGRVALCHVPSLGLGGKADAGARVLVKPAVDKKTGGPLGADAVSPKYGTPKCEFICQLAELEGGGYVGAHPSIGESAANALLARTNLLGDVWDGDRGAAEIRREVVAPFGADMRADFVVNQKGPDGEKVVSARAIKHVDALADIARSGDGAAAVLFVAVRDCAVFKPNAEACPSFAAHLRAASRAGVAVLARKLRWDVADGVARAYDAGPVPVDLLE
ncbi:hypothetical protein JL722_4942 [Aureococcus anophagefferens]|nr:hypothetical protein JL722_4942 [Aureococcus anophagefferens]